MIRTEVLVNIFTYLLLQTNIVFLVKSFTVSIYVYIHYFFFVIFVSVRENWTLFYQVCQMLLLVGLFFDSRCNPLFRPFPSCFSSRNHCIHLNIVTSFIFNFTWVKCFIILDQHPITNNYFLFPSKGLGFPGNWKSLCFSR